MAYIIFNIVLFHFFLIQADLSARNLKNGRFKRFSTYSKSLIFDFYDRNLCNRPDIFRISSWHSLRKVFHSGFWLAENSWKLTRPMYILQWNCPRATVTLMNRQPFSLQWIQWWSINSATFFWSNHIESIAFEARIAYVSESTRPKSVDLKREIFFSSSVSQSASDITYFVHLTSMDVSYGWPYSVFGYIMLATHSLNSGGAN